jgi:hypothetical protein
MSTWIVGYRGGSLRVGADAAAPRKAKRAPVKKIKISDVKDVTLLLEPETRALYNQLEGILLAKYGIKLRRGRTRGTQEGEKALATAGKSALTSGISWHLLGRAIDVYPIDPATGQPDMMAKNINLYRALHNEWHALGGMGLAFLPYPNGPIRKLKTPDGRVFYDLGHLEYHGNYPNLLTAYQAEKHLLEQFV